MNLQQVKEAGKWTLCKLDVQSIGELYLTTHGLAQKIEAIDESGICGIITMYITDETFAVDRDKTGPREYRVRYKSGLVGYPMEPIKQDIGRILMKAPPQEKKQRDLPPAGTKLAICYHVVDIGTHQKIYPGKPPKNVRLIRLGWELPECRHEFETKEGEKVDKPFAIWCEYTFSTYVKANLSMLIVPWMGKCDDNFDFASLVGSGCYLSIVHEVGGDNNTYANVKGAMQLPPSVIVPPMFNEPQFYDLTEMGRDFPAWLLEEKMSWLKEKIESCQEFAQMNHAAGIIRASGLDENFDEALPDDIPF